LHAACRVERELKKWEPEGPLANLSLDMAAGKGGKGGHWDQFEVNKRMFKVRDAS
jgi:PAB1-binding protein PBP1